MSYMLKPLKSMIKIFYLLYVCIYLVMVGCFFHGLCQVVTMNAQPSSNYDSVQWV